MRSGRAIGLRALDSSPDEPVSILIHPQVEVFEKQMGLATSLQRPVSIHCVRAHGFLFDYLRERPSACPPSISFHSYSGSADHARSLLK